MSVPSLELGSPPPPPQASVSPPLDLKGGGGTQFGRLDRKPGTLYALYGKGVDMCLDVGLEPFYENVVFSFRMQKYCARALYHAVSLFMVSTVTRYNFL